MFKLYNVFKAINNYNKLSNAVFLRSLQAFSTFGARNQNLTKNLRIHFENHYISRNNPYLKSVLALNILTWLGFMDTDEEKESELIMTLKRAVLATKKEQYDKAEQLLHIALRLAQQQQNEQGITYCYDLMANVALSKVELEKAQKLFVSVLQRLLSTGTSQEDLKVIHISLKLARILHLKAEEETAEMGYVWCLEQIEKAANSNDKRVLYGVINDWYSQFLLDTGNTQKSLYHLKEAYKVCCEMQGEKSEQSMLLLNDLGIISWRIDDLEAAQRFLTEAAQIGHNVEDKSHIGAVYANLGLILLQKGVVEDAQKYCKEAWQLGNRYENNEAKEQANYCFDQIKSHLGK